MIEKKVGSRSTIPDQMPAEPPTTKPRLVKISAVIIAKDAETTIGATLASLSQFEDVVVYDNGSTDNTCSIVEQFEWVRLIKGEFIGYGATKNRAADYANNDLIFSLDSDEVVTNELLAELEQCQHQWQRHQVGQVKRLNYYLGKPVRFGDWSKDRVVRLYDRREHQFCLRSVHESIERKKESTELVRFRSLLKHNTVISISQSLQKIDRYSELYATDRLESAKLYHPWICILKAKFAFFRSYLFRGGFLDGWRGLVIAYGVAVGVFYKYVKPYAAADIGGFESDEAGVDAAKGGGARHDGSFLASEIASEAESAQRVVTMSMKADLSNVEPSANQELMAPKTISRKC